MMVSHAHRDAMFVLRWTLAAEAEADRHTRTRQKPLSVIRESLDWDSMLVADATDEQTARLEDTSPKDRHVLAAAVAAGARAVVTRNVADFGRTDLGRTGTVAVHPDLFLATTTTSAMYHATLVQMSTARTLPPNTPETLHTALATEHPRLVEAMRWVFPGVQPSPTDHNPPAESFRGNRCLRCGKTLRDPGSLTLGVGPECRRGVDART